MKTFRPTFVLIGLFFAGLLVLWWLEDSGVPTEAQRRGRLNRVLPDLIDVPETAVTRLEILRGGETLAFERKGTDRWQMTRPLDVAADSTIVETLIGNLKNLRQNRTGWLLPARSSGSGATPVRKPRRSPVCLPRSRSARRFATSVSFGRSTRRESKWSIRSCWVLQVCR
jgi:hypothetical protein